ncbi:hypothetical protein HanXRQr2_Chr13g0572011 [Helianthus annuus]|uniref:Uncharacterized protein n=1 Tax=Helianthus annuus TaxID=4232 RepID=A0A9K3HAC5_HELAN|nr:hypothetical protein HanXRQr2_Chr13g0572011 [Helianthus annuus]KAJ0847895.1 hypothetical protein HanPSC8_Chr13g0550681 [Helianthus annuus]
MGYGAGLGRGLGTNAQVTIPGGLGFRRGPLGGVSAWALGGPSGLPWSALISWVG